MLQPGNEPVPGLWLTQPLGSGGFGDVWEARDRKGKLVALKFMDCRTKSTSLIAGEIRVLRGLAELEHPRFIRLFGVHAASHYIILIMERADGNLADLQEFYRQDTGQGIPADHLFEMLQQVAEGLDFLAELHLPAFNRSSRGLQHCDIKPANLLLVGEDVKIADFGLCAGASWKTHRQGWCGTLPYAAPELFRGQPSVGTDQYALAITYLTLGIGERAFFPTALSDSKLGALPVDLTKVREAELPVLARALHPQPTYRWPSCTAFITALRKALASPRSTASRRRKGGSGLHPVCR
jgi:serine/threonine protein kinase